MASGNLNISGINFQLTKIWENPNPTSSFTSGWMGLDIGQEEPDGMLVFFKPNISYDELSSMICTFYYTHILYGYALGGTAKSTRSISIATHTTTDSVDVWVGGGYSGSTADNNRCVPIFIYTYKLLVTM